MIRTITDDDALGFLKETLSLDRRPDLAAQLSRETQIDDISIDSLRMTELILEFEEKFDVELKDSELLKMSSAKTVGEFIDAFKLTH